MKLNRRTLLAAAATATAGSICIPYIARAQTHKMAVGYFVGNSIYWDLIVAEKKGLFSNNGLEPTFTNLQSSPQGIQLAVSGSLDLVAVQPEPMVAAFEQGGTNLGILTAPMNMADWTLNVQPEIKNLRDLRGKVIGVSALQNSECWQTEQMLAGAGVGPGEFDFLVVGTSPSKIIALQQKSIAATILFQPSGELAVQEGYPSLIKYSALRQYPPIVYTARREWAATGAGKMASNALRKAHDWLYDPTNREEAVALLAGVTNRDPALLDRIYDMYFVTDPIYSKTGAVSGAGLNAALVDMVEKGDFMQDSKPDPEKYLIPESEGGLRE